MPGKTIENSAEVEALIKQCNYCIMSMCDGDTPYAVPMNIVYDGEYFYMHSGLKGRKINFLRKNPKVALTFVPSASFVMRHEKSACGGSMDFESICVNGVAEVLEPANNMEALCAGLQHIADYFKVGHLPLDERVLAVTSVIRVKASSIIGKRNPGR